MKRAEEPERSPKGRAKLSLSFQSFCLSFAAPPLVLLSDLSIWLRLHLSVSLFCLSPPLSITPLPLFAVTVQFGESP